MLGATSFAVVSTRTLAIYSRQYPKNCKSSRQNSSLDVLAMALWDGCSTGARCDSGVSLLLLGVLADQGFGSNSQCTS